MNINYDLIPSLAVGFSRAKSLPARVIQLVRGILKNANEPNHAFFVIELYNQKFVIEETARGLVINSLDEYKYKENKIVAMYYWTGWDDPVRYMTAVNRLLYLVRKQGDRKTKEGKYGWWGLFSFLPVVGKWLSPGKEGDGNDWCSENVADVHKAQGGWDAIKDVHLAPDELLPIMARSNECREIPCVYKGAVCSGKD